MPKSRRVIQYGITALPVKGYRKKILKEKWAFSHSYNLTLTIFPGKKKKKKISKNSLDYFTLFRCHGRSSFWESTVLSKIVIWLKYYRDIINLVCRYKYGQKTTIFFSTNGSHFHKYYWCSVKHETLCSVNPRCTSSLWQNYIWEINESPADKVQANSDDQKNNFFLRDNYAVRLYDAKIKIDI